MYTPRPNRKKISRALTQCKRMVKSPYPAVESFNMASVSRHRAGATVIIDGNVDKLTFRHLGHFTGFADFDPHLDHGADGSPPDVLRCWSATDRRSHRYRP